MKIFIVDDHEMMSFGIKTWIEGNTDYQVIGSAQNIEDTLGILKNLSDEQKPDVLIVDVDLGDDDGFNLVRLIKKQYSDIKILMYSMHKSNGYLLDSKKSGANGYLSKDAKNEEFKIALKKIIAGQDCFDEDFSVKSARIQEALKLLTPQEQVIFQEILKGLSNEDISKSMNISVHSVEVYVSRVYSKLDVHFREDLIAKYN